MKRKVIEMDGIQKTVVLALRKMADDADLYLNGEIDYQVGGEDNDPVMGMPPSVTLAMDSWNLIGVYSNGR